LNDGLPQKHVGINMVSFVRTVFRVLAIRRR
jgi:hypothetical protein